DFFAFESGFHGGVQVAAYNPVGSGPALVAVGAGAGGAPRMLVLDCAALARDPSAALANPESDAFIADPIARAGVEFSAGPGVSRFMAYRAGGQSGDDGWIITGIQVL